MSDSTIKQLIVLDGSNYSSWKTRMMMKIRNKRLLRCIEDKSFIDIDLDGRCMELLLDNIHPDLDHLISDLSTSYQIWNKLSSHFDKQTMTTAMNLYSSLASVIKSDTENIRDLAHRININYNKLKELKYTIDDLKILTLLHSLPPKYDAIITSIVDKQKSEWVYDEIVEKLVESESRISKWDQINEIEIAMKAKDKNICSHCKKSGHTYEKCYWNPVNKSTRPKWVKDKLMNKSDEHNDENFSLFSQTALKAIDNNGLSTMWYIDSGATQHFSPFKQLFKNYININSYDVNIANGGHVQVIGKGDITITIKYNNKPREITFTNVQHSPNMEYNLLSVSIG